MRQRELLRQLRAAEAAQLPLDPDAIGSLRLWGRLLRTLLRDALRVGAGAGVATGMVVFAGTGLVDGQVWRTPLTGLVTLAALGVVFAAGAMAVCAGLAVLLALGMTVRGQLWHRRYAAAWMAGTYATVLGLAAGGAALTQLEEPGVFTNGFGVPHVIAILVTVVVAIIAGRAVRRVVAYLIARHVAPPLAVRVRLRGALLSAGLLAVGLGTVGWWWQQASTPGVPRHDERIAESLVLTSDRHVIVMGIDGLGWDAVRQGFGDGSLQNWETLERRGGRGRVYSHTGQGPAAFWITAATGFSAAEHGVRALEMPHLAWARPPFAFAQEHVLLRTVYGRVFPCLGLGRLVPVSRHGVRAWMAWEIVRQAGGEAGIIGWWGAWPGAGESGTLDMCALLQGDWSADSPLAIDARVGEGLRAILHRTPRPALTMAYFPGLDLLHRNPGAAAGADVEPAHRRFLDALIGEVAAALGPEDLLLVVGDRGRRDARACPPGGGEDDGGVMLAAGSAVAPATRISRPRPEDVWPTVAWWLALPAAQNWTGRAWTALRPDLPSPAPILTYGRPARSDDLSLAAAALRRRQLRQMGYLH